MMCVVHAPHIASILRVHISRDCLLLRFVGAMTGWRLRMIKSLV